MSDEERSSRAQQWAQGADTSNPSDASNQAESSDTSESADTSKRSENSDDLRKPENVKQEWDGVYIYLPSNDENELVERINTAYERLRYECSRDADVSIQKDRHFKPVLIVDGLETIEELSGEDFIDRVEELGFR